MAVKKAAENLAVLEQKLARGASPETALDGMADAETMAVSYFLRVFRGRADLSALFEDKISDSFTKRLETIRNLVFQGRIEEARSAVAGADPGSELEKSELLLEATRIAVMSGDAEEALRCSQAALDLRATTEVSRMTLLQLRGHAFLLRKEPEKAIDSLHHATVLASLFPNLSSAFSAHAFLVQAYSELGRREEAQAALSAARHLLGCVEQDEMWVDRLLTCVRAQTHFHRAFQEQGALRATLEEALAIARWLGDQVTESKCRRELDQVPASEGMSLAIPVVQVFPTWMLLPSHDLILSLVPKKVVRIHDSPILRKILLALLEGPVATADLFEKVWNLPYHAERHGTHLRATLSKVRKSLPAGALRVEDGMIFLPR